MSASMPIVIIDQHYGLQSSEAKMIANAASNTRALSPQELPDYLRLAIQIGGSSWSLLRGIVPPLRCLSV